MGNAGHNRFREVSGTQQLYARIHRTLPSIVQGQTASQRSRFCTLTQLAPATRAHPSGNALAAGIAASFHQGIRRKLVLLCRVVPTCRGTPHQAGPPSRASHSTACSAMNIGTLAHKVPPDSPKVSRFTNSFWFKRFVHLSEPVGLTNKPLVHSTFWIENNPHSK